MTTPGRAGVPTDASGAVRPGRTDCSMHLGKAATTRVGPGSQSAGRAPAADGRPIDMQGKDPGDGQRDIGPAENRDPECLGAASDRRRACCRCRCRQHRQPSMPSGSVSGRQWSAPARSGPARSAMSGLDEVVTVPAVSTERRPESVRGTRCTLFGCVTRGRARPARVASALPVTCTAADDP
jgi:hypothetical protein